MVVLLCISPGLRFLRAKDLAAAKQPKQMVIDTCEPYLVDDAYEHQVLVTSLTDNIPTIVKWYRDCADAENVLTKYKITGAGAGSPRTPSPSPKPPHASLPSTIMGGPSSVASLAPITTAKPSPPNQHSCTALCDKPPLADNAPSPSPAPAPTATKTSSPFSSPNSPHGLLNFQQLRSSGPPQRDEKHS